MDEQLVKNIEQYIDSVTEVLTKQANLEQSHIHISKQAAAQIINALNKGRSIDNQLTISDLIDHPDKVTANLNKIAHIATSSNAQQPLSLGGVRHVECGAGAEIRTSDQVYRESFYY